MKEERSLAHVEVIKELSPIPGADRIEVATVLGWKCVVKKGEFKVGDKIIYIEIDSIVPPKPQFEFLKDRNYRVRTIKLRKQISQGLVIPITSLNTSNKHFTIFSEGADVTEKLGITKYLTPSERTELEVMRREASKLTKFMRRYSWYRRLFLKSKKPKGSFPFWVSKTDEERVQNLKDLESILDEEVYITEKIDYQSGTWTAKETPVYSGLLGKIFKKTKMQFVVASRNLTTNDKNSLYWRIAEKYNLNRLLTTTFKGYTIQGEQGSTNVQGNKYGLNGPKMWVFNILIDGYYLDYPSMKIMCKQNNLDIVPLLYEGRLRDIGTTVAELVKYSEGKSLINPKIQREGIVIRRISGGKKLISFKVINPNFLLKYEN